MYFIFYIALDYAQTRQEKKLSFAVPFAVPSAGIRLPFHLPFHFCGLPLYYVNRVLVGLISTGLCWGNAIRMEGRGGTRMSNGI